MRTWQNCGQSLKQTPSKSSLSEARQKVSYQFFEDVFRTDLERDSRETFRGLHIYAADGDQYELPNSSDVTSYDYVGWPSSRNRETHYPKMYACHVLDVLSGEIREFSFSNRQDEVHLARGMVKTLERNSVTIYDRLHSGYDTFLSHHQAENFYLVRARTDGNGVHTSVREFLKSSARSKTVEWRAQPGERKQKRITMQVRLVKIKHPKTKRVYVFITNLPEDLFSNKTIGQMYRKRWEIETAFKDLTVTGAKLGKQWHSKKINGVLQEIFALLWLTNAVKRQMRVKEKTKAKDLLKRNYRRSNFKLTLSLVIDSIGLLLRGHVRKFYQLITAFIERTLERRKRDSRSYERCVKHRGREYKHRNLVPRRKRLCA